MCLLNTVFVALLLQLTWAIFREDKMWDHIMIHSEGSLLWFSFLGRHSWMIPWPKRVKFLCDSTLLILDSPNTTTLSFLLYVLLLKNVNWGYFLLLHTYFIRNQVCTINKYRYYNRELRVLTTVIFRGIKCYSISWFMVKGVTIFNQNIFYNVFW